MAVASASGLTPPVGRHEDPDLERESYRLVFPASGTTVGGAIKRFANPFALPIYAGAVVAGHAVGRIEARLVPDRGVETLVAEDDVESLPDALVSPEARAEPGDEDDTGTWRLAWWPFGRR